MTEFQNDEVESLARDSHTLPGLRRIRDLLDRHGVFQFPSLPSGLFSAAKVTADRSHTGYANVWVRDNVHIAHALRIEQRTVEASRTLLALAAHFGRQRERMELITRDSSRAADAMNRPHVRFDGAASSDLAEQWPHAQNDALGYFLWLFCRLARAGDIPVGGEELAIPEHLLRYLASIRYWEDEDSGHWEEGRRISASSIGTVVAGLQEMRSFLTDFAQPPAVTSRVSIGLVDDLLTEGRRQLGAILPRECAQRDAEKERRFDSALLFLIYPLEVVNDVMADRILKDVDTHLKGDIGIKRYLGDSFWCRDYWRNLKAGDRTRDFSGDMATRDDLFVPGTEAQWCLFDPVISVIRGRRYQRYRRPEDLAEQAAHLNRALAHITGRSSRCGSGADQLAIGPFKCPELYHLETVESGRLELQPSEATPLLWTQAVLLTALSSMEQSVRMSGA